jgi:hypothetical protein
MQFFALSLNPFANMKILPLFIFKKQGHPKSLFSLPERKDPKTLCSQMQD